MTQAAHVEQAQQILIALGLPAAQQRAVAAGAHGNTGAPLPRHPKRLSLCVARRSL